MQRNKALWNEPFVNEPKMVVLPILQMLPFRDVLFVIDIDFDPLLNYNLFHNLQLIMVYEHECIKSLHSINIYADLFTRCWT